MAQLTGETSNQIFAELEDCKQVLKHISLARPRPPQPSRGGRHVTGFDGQFREQGTRRPFSIRLEDKRRQLAEIENDLADDVIANAPSFDKAA